MRISELQNNLIANVLVKQLVGCDFIFMWSITLFLWPGQVYCHNLLNPEISARFRNIYWVRVDFQSRMISLTHLIPKDLRPKMQKISTVLTALQETLLLNVKESNWSIRLLLKKIRQYNTLLVVYYVPI